MADDKWDAMLLSDADLVAAIYCKMREVSDENALGLTDMVLRYFAPVYWRWEPEYDEDVPF